MTSFNVWGDNVRFWEGFRQQLFPPKCVFCRRVLDQDGICEKCRTSLLYNRPNEPITDIPFVDAAYSCFHYEGDVKNAIIRYKFGGVSKYSVDFSEFIEICIQKDLCNDFDIISWVPLSKKRLRSRGYDQARLLAEEVCNRIGVRAVRTLIKSRNSVPQSRQNDISKRRANVLGTYELAHIDVVDKRIILLDDVLTTGSTVSECARVLKSAGAKKINIITIAKAHSRKRD